MFDRNSNVCEEMSLLFHAQRALVFSLLSWVHKSNARRGLNKVLDLRQTHRTEALCLLKKCDPLYITECTGQTTNMDTAHWGKPRFSKILLNLVNYWRVL